MAALHSLTSIAPRGHKQTSFHDLTSEMCHTVCSIFENKKGSHNTYLTL